MKLFAFLAASAAADVFEEGENKITEGLKSCNWDGSLPLGRSLHGQGEDRVIDPDRVIGGKDVVHGDWPWIVGFSENGNRVCAGTVIHDRWVISAEHCLPQHILPRGRTTITAEEDDSITWTKLYFGDHHKNRADQSEFWLVPQKLVFRENRTRNGRRDTTAADIMLIQVESISAKIGADFTDYIKPACMPDVFGVAQTAQDPYAGKHCWIAGWGYTRFGETWWGGLGGSKLAPILQEAGISIFSNDYCIEKSHMIEAATQAQVTGSGFLQTYNEFCAGIPDRDGDGETDGGIDACSGDSGGPLICDVDGNAVLVGITSRGKGCAMANNPGVYTPTWMFTDWVNKVIAEQTDPEDNDGGETNPTDQPSSTPAPSFTELTDDILVIVSERSTGTASCFKPNGEAHTNKTKGQNRARAKKLNMYKKQIQKFVGVKRSAKPCEDFSLKAKLDDYCTPGSLEDMLAQVSNFDKLSEMTEGIINTYYGGCRPASNWARAAKNKVKGLVQWESKAQKQGCVISK